jgi:hypothetical protein
VKIQSDIKRGGISQVFGVGCENLVRYKGKGGKSEISVSYMRSGVRTQSGIRGGV